MTPYVPRPALDTALADRIARGAGAFAIEGPPGAGKSAALLHALQAEMGRRGAPGRGYVRLVQLWGDEPPSLFARRLVREATHLHLSSYPDPERLRVLVETMASAVPGLHAAGRLLAALVPDDLRPLHEIAAAALGEIGQKAVERGGPLCIGVDLLGGTVSEGARDFFRRLQAALPPTVVLLVAQPGGAQSLLPAAEQNRIPVGPFTLEEARAYLRDRIGPLGGDDEVLLASGGLSLLPGDLGQLAQQYRMLGAGAGLRGVAAALSDDVASRYQALYQDACAREGAEWQAAAELCAWVALSARPDRPLSAADALRRVDVGGHMRPSELWRLRHHELVRALCATVVPADPEAPLGDGGWPLGPRHGHAQRGVLAALRAGGVLDLYEERWLAELWPGPWRAGEAEGGPAPPAAGSSGPRPGGGIAGGVQAMLLLLDRVRRAGRTAGDGPDAGRALRLLGELEVPLWRAGWHRTFAELFDALAACLAPLGTSLRDAAPALWFRRARARIQAVDWSASGAPTPGRDEELPRALAELEELGRIDDGAALAARLRLGLPADGEEVARQRRHLTRKAAQARAYARILGLLLGAPVGDRQGTLRRALDELLPSLAYFAAERRGEDLAQSLTILGDWYSAQGDGSPGDSEEARAADRLALEQYAEAARLAEAGGHHFCLGVIQRSLARHHRRRDRGASALQAAAEARRWLLRDPGSRMGTLLANLP